MKSIFDEFDLILLDSLVEDAQLRCSKVLGLISDSSDSYRYFHLQRKFDSLMKLSRKLESLMKQII